jgi:hypothetical protein
VKSLAIVNSFNPASHFSPRLFCCSVSDKLEPLVHAVGHCKVLKKRTSAGNLKTEFASLARFSEFANEVVEISYRYEWGATVHSEYAKNIILSSQALALIH